MHICFILAGILISLGTFASGGLVLPGFAPRGYVDGERIGTKVNKLTSATKLLGYDYYTLPFCRPTSYVDDVIPNLGESITGETYHSTAYEIFSHRDEQCKILCTIQYEGSNNGSTENAYSLLKNFIRDEYSAHYLVDDLPVAAAGITQDASVLYGKGIPIGGYDPENQKFFLYNHIRFHIYYNEDSSFSGRRVVKVEAIPFSVQQSSEINKDCPRLVPGRAITSPMYLEDEALLDAPTTIVFSYDVHYVKSNVPWRSRWDVYLSMGGKDYTKQRWYNTLRSFIVFSILSATVSFLFVRELRRDIAKFHLENKDEESGLGDAMDSGWKALHADVFRPPKQGVFFLPVLVGAGTQLLLMAMGVAVLGSTGFLSPANRGALALSIVLTFIASSAIGGYTTARLHKMFYGKQWQRVIIVTALALPTIMVPVLLVLNGIAWSKGSVNAVRFKSIVALLALWFFVSVPLMFFGAYHGFKAKRIKLPTKTNRIPRQIPSQPWYTNKYLMIALGGVLPFTALYFEFFFVLNSIWQGDYYNSFDILLLTWVLALLLAAQCSIFATFVILNNENHRWWWMSLLIPAISGTYMFVYSIFYQIFVLNIHDHVSRLVYYTCMGLVAGILTLIISSVGFLSALKFVHKLYSSIHVD